MAEELSIDNILTEGEIDSLFTDESPDTPPEEGGEEEPNKETDKTTEVNVDALFTEEPESVGSEDNTKGEEEAPSQGGTSPITFSSLAKALAEEGIFQDLDDNKLSEIKTPDDFRSLFEEQIKANLDERQKRIDEALNLDIEPSEVSRYEKTISYLDGLKDEDLTDEGEKGEKLRKNLIYQDFINKGFDHERALREVNKSLNGGTDVEDAKEALRSNRAFFKKEYETLITEAREDREKELKERQKQSEELRNSILNDKNVFGDLSIDKSTRQRIYDSIAKPVFKDPETGEMLTAIQKYESEHRADFLKYLGLFYTMTNGFTSLDGLVKDKVKKEKKKGLSELEHTLNNTARTPSGSLDFASGVDGSSYIGKGWDLDV